MENLQVTASHILKASIYECFRKNKVNNFGLKNVVIPFAKNTNLNYDKTERFAMKYFLLNKQSTVEENVLFTAKILYEEIGNSKLHIDELFLKFVKKQEITLNLNIERILYLALTFLFTIGKIKFNDNMIERIE
ncbi:ABC-three component system middle component 6 [Bacillus cereus group sp. Bce033]|uniref:ABC-three component system middle component 6 n=1 Tax=Bacillus TaxID=1386 RepID=UPI0007EEAAAA|nr:MULTISPECIES: ABC-three component system middle component 6 [Bacillus]MCU5436797.1 hypothetical protein [Bacillus mobilis]MDA1509871.1 hypothetical protein [Bacillus cereus group sp. TH36-2LC]